MAAGPLDLDVRLSTTAPETAIWAVALRRLARQRGPPADARAAVDQLPADQCARQSLPRPERQHRPAVRRLLAVPAGRRPGHPRRYHVEFWPIGNRFEAGHRIRLHLARRVRGVQAERPAVNTIVLGGHEALAADVPGAARQRPALRDQVSDTPTAPIPPRRAAVAGRPQSCESGQMRSDLLTRAARLVALAVVTAALAVPAVAGAASVAYIDKGEVWLSRWTARRRRGWRRPWSTGAARPRPGSTSRTPTRPDRCGTQQAGPDVVVLVVQDLGARRELDRRGTAQRTGRLDHLRLSARLRHHGGRLAPRLRLLELQQLLPDHLRPWDVRPAGDEQRPPSDQPRHPDDPSLLGNRICRSRMLVLRSSSRPERRWGQPLYEQFTAWLDDSGVGLDLNRVDVAADGNLTALGFEAWARRHADGRQDRDARDAGDRWDSHAPPTRGLLPARGRHRAGRIARAGRGTIAWKDDGGLKVAGPPRPPTTRA